MKEGLICLICPWFNLSPLLGAKSVTVVNSTTAPGTLGIYQPLNWAWLAGEHTGVINNREEPHLSSIYNIY